MDFALILDIVVVAILLISCVVAFLRGLVREVLTILALVGAIAMALIFGPKLAPGIEGWLTADLAADATDEKLWGFIPYDIAASLFAYAGLFVITMAVLSMISHFIAKSVHAVGLGPVDRSLGVIFGMVRGLVLIGLLYTPFYLLMDPKDKKEWFGPAQTYLYVEKTTAFLLSMMPKDWIPEPKEEETEEDLDPLKNLSGEHDEKEERLDAIGTDEDAAEEQGATGYDSMERKAIDALIEKQEEIRAVIEGSDSKQDTETNE